MQENFEPIEFDPKNSKNRRIVIGIIIVLLIAILATAAALLVKHYVISTFIVDGASMYPTLDGGGGPDIQPDTPENRVDGEVLYLNKLAKIQRGDIVVFDLTENSKKTTLVKRVIGVAGDRIQIIDNLLYRNGVLLDESSYIREPMQHTENLNIVVEEGHIFCMGDNRNASYDSRAFGSVSLENVVGKCFLIKGMDGKLRVCK